MTELLGVEPSKVGQTPDGTVRVTWAPNENTRIRFESHPEGLSSSDPGYNPRHHGEHYHIETKPPGTSGTRQKRRVRSKRLIQWDTHQEAEPAFWPVRRSQEPQTEQHMIKLSDAHILEWSLSETELVITLRLWNDRPALLFVRDIEFFSGTPLANAELSHLSSVLGNAMSGHFEPALKAELPFYTHELFSPWDDRPLMTLVSRCEAVLELRPPSSAALALHKP